MFSLGFHPSLAALDCVYWAALCAAFFLVVALFGAITAGAGRDLTITSAANSASQFFDTKKHDLDKSSVTQVQSTLSSGGNVTLGAGNDLLLARAGRPFYLIQSMFPNSSEEKAYKIFGKNIQQIDTRSRVEVVMKKAHSFAVSGLLLLSLIACSSNQQANNLNEKQFEATNTFWLDSFEIEQFTEHKDFPSKSSVTNTFFDLIVSSGKESGIFPDTREKADFFVKIYFDYTRGFGFLFEKNTMKAAGYSYDIEIYDKSGARVTDFTVNKGMRSLTGILNYGSNLKSTLKSVVGKSNPEVENKYIDHFAGEIEKKIASLRKTSTSSAL
jgi:hypothetical protein